MIQGSLKKWQVDKDNITVTMVVPNTWENRNDLAAMCIESPCCMDNAQGELNLMGGEAV